MYQPWVRNGATNRMVRWCIVTALTNTHPSAGPRPVATRLWQWKHPPSKGLLVQAAGRHPSLNTHPSFPASSFLSHLCPCSELISASQGQSGLSAGPRAPGPSPREMEDALGATG